MSISRSKTSISSGQTSISRSETSISSGQTSISRSETSIGLGQTSISRRQTSIGLGQTSISRSETSISRGKTSTNGLFRGIPPVMPKPRCIFLLLTTYYLPLTTFLLKAHCLCSKQTAIQVCISSNHPGVPPPLKSGIRRCLFGKLVYGDFKKR